MRCLHIWSCFESSQYNARVPTLPVKIYRAAEVRRVDQIAIEQLEIPGYTLMSRAGQAALEALRAHWPRARRLLVLCGAGNNAGDGYVIARLAAAAGLHVVTVGLGAAPKLAGDAELAFNMFRQGGGRLTQWEPRLLHGCDVVVDALLGTGLARPLQGLIFEVVESVNHSGKPVLAVDIPTGLNADSGQVMGTAIRADLTVTFVGLKLGLMTGEGPDYTGDIIFEDLGIPSEAYSDISPVAYRINRDLAAKVLPRRPRSAHKGNSGRVLLVGGGRGMPGAIRLSAEAALHAGAGLVTVATQPDHVPVVVAGRPEVMATGVRSAADLKPMLAQADIVAIGPGLGRDDWARELLRAALDAGKPLVVDADALTLMATMQLKRDNWILTPHPGEAGRLLAAFEPECDAAVVQADRSGAAKRIYAHYGGVVVLKGAGTIVGREGDLPWFCDKGNPGMAAPGMGDVLTGVIAAIAAQCGDLFAAARAGVWVHASAGDAAAAGGERGIIASDLFGHIVTYVNPE